MKKKSIIKEIEDISYKSLVLDVNKIQQDGAAEYIFQQADDESAFDEEEKDEDQNQSSTDIN